MALTASHLSGFLFQWSILVAGPFHFFQQLEGAGYLCLIHHELDAAHGVAEKGADGNRVFVEKIAFDMLFFQPGENEMCGKIVIV